ncbi:DNA replication terminus site-binding protein [Escherichia coli]|uniref:DNA replication terminus site-binding protein n=1 Tax=Escherichia coli TaxID=562 RepID=UPI000AF2B821|nr:DNA replication terminus site-binding protein [Escherichia coli]
MSYDDLPYFRDQILERIDSLKCFLSNTPPLMANLMTVSTVSRTEERLKQVKPIRVSVKDDASVEEIIQALTDICVDDIESLSHDSTKVTTKYPGLIIVPERADLLESLITSINEAKNDFAAAMRRIDNKKNVRFDKVHKKLPGLVAMHSTRNVLFIKSQLKKVTFSWRLNRNQEVKTAEQLVSLLERRRASEVKNVATTNLNVVSNIDKALHPS